MLVQSPAGYQTGFAASQPKLLKTSNLQLMSPTLHYTQQSSGLQKKEALIASPQICSTSIKNCHCRLCGDVARVFWQPFPQVR